MGRIFISYRRDDNRDFVDHLIDRLKGDFGKAVFQDVESILAGDVFRERIHDTIAHADIEIVVIGQRWLTLSNDAGGRRIDDENDLVRKEVETALSYGVPIIPVLIDDASTLDKANLPSTIAKLAEIHATSVRRNPNFAPDMQALARAIRRQRLTAIRRGRRATRRYVTNHSVIIKRAMMIAVTTLLVGFCIISLTLGNWLNLPVLWGSVPSGTPAPTSSIAPGTLSPTAKITTSWSTLHPGYFAVTVTGFSPGSYPLSCNYIGEKNIPPRVSQFTVIVETNPQKFDDGKTCKSEQISDEVWITYGTLASSPLWAADAFKIATPTPPSSIITPTSGTVFETASEVGAGTFTDYTNADGALGQRVAAYQTIKVSCRLTGFKVADGNTWWYRIAQSPWNNGYYASADNFYNNGQTSGTLIGTPFVDSSVPLC